MSTAVSLFYLRETNHLLGALTRKASESGEMDEAELRRVIPDGLVLRRLANTQLTPIEPPTAPGRRATTDFKVDVRHISVAATEIDRADQAAYLSRPTEFSLIDGVPTKTLPATDGVTKLTIEGKETSVKVTVHPDLRTMISEEIPVWCLIKTNPDNRVLVQTAKIPKNPNLNRRAA